MAGSDDSGFIYLARLRSGQTAKMNHRNAQEVAQRALVMGAVAFRASLEVTNHPRTQSLAEAIPQWLDGLGVSNALDPIERDLLHTPYGQLDQSQRIDANWSGEGAALFAWILGVSEKPPLLRVADHDEVLTNLRVMRSGADVVLENASLRQGFDLLAFCKEVRLMRVVLRENHVFESGLDAEAKDVAMSIGRMKVVADLAGCGIDVSDDDFDQWQDIVVNAASEERQAATGAYVARDVAVAWLLDDRQQYFDHR